MPRSLPYSWRAATLVWRGSTFSNRLVPSCSCPTCHKDCIWLMSFGPVLTCGMPSSLCLCSSAPTASPCCACTAPGSWRACCPAAPALCAPAWRSSGFRLARRPGRRPRGGLQPREGRQLRRVLRPWPVWGTLRKPAGVARLRPPPRRQPPLAHPPLVSEKLPSTWPEPRQPCGVHRRPAAATRRRALEAHCWQVDPSAEPGPCAASHARQCPVRRGHSGQHGYPHPCPSRVLRGGDL